jgi:hypothetical protein
LANIARNTYIFYGDKAELARCHKELSRLHEKFGDTLSCVDMATENTVVNCEWIECIEELSEDACSFCMNTESKWYGNPVYWNNWVKTNFPELSVAFRCEEPCMEIFEKVDPDNKFDDCIYISGSDILDEDIEKLPQVLKNKIIEGCVWGTFIKDEIFNSEFQPSDLPDSVAYNEYSSTTYDAIRASDEAYLTKYLI